MGKQMTETIEACSSGDMIVPPATCPSKLQQVEEDENQVLFNQLWLQVYRKLADKANFYAFQSAMFLGMEPMRSVGWWMTCASSECLASLLNRLCSPEMRLTGKPRSTQYIYTHPTEGEDRWSQDVLHPIEFNPRHPGDLPEDDACTGNNAYDERRVCPTTTKAGQKVFAIHFATTADSRSSLGSRNMGGEEDSSKAASSSGKGSVVTSLRAAYSMQFLIRVDAGRQQIIYDLYEFVPELLTCYSKPSREEMLEMYQKFTQPEGPAEEAAKEAAKQLGQEPVIDEAMEERVWQWWLVSQFEQFTSSRVLRCRLPMSSIVALRLCHAQQPEPASRTPATADTAQNLGGAYDSSNNSNTSEDGEAGLVYEPSKEESCVLGVEARPKVTSEREPRAVLSLQLSSPPPEEGFAQRRVCQRSNAHSDCINGYDWEGGGGSGFEIVEDWTPQRTASRATQHYITGDFLELQELANYILSVCPPLRLRVLGEEQEQKQEAEQGLEQGDEQGHKQADQGEKRRDGASQEKLDAQRIPGEEGAPRLEHAPLSCGCTTERAYPSGDDLAATCISSDTAKATVAELGSALNGPASGSHYKNPSEEQCRVTQDAEVTHGEDGKAMREESGRAVEEASTNPRLMSKHSEGWDGEGEREVPCTLNADCPKPLDTSNLDPEAAERWRALQTLASQAGLPSEAAVSHCLRQGVLLGHVRVDKEPWDLRDMAESGSRGSEFGSGSDGLGSGGSGAGSCDERRSALHRVLHRGECCQCGWPLECTLEQVLCGWQPQEDAGSGVDEDGSGVFDEDLTVAAGKQEVLAEGEELVDDNSPPGRPARHTRCTQQGGITPALTVTGSTPALLNLRDTSGEAEMAAYSPPDSREGDDYREVDQEAGEALEPLRRRGGCIIRCDGGCTNYVTGLCSGTPQFTARPPPCRRFGTCPLCEPTAGDAMAIREASSPHNSGSGTNCAGAAANALGNSHLYFGSDAHPRAAAESPVLGNAHPVDGGKNTNRNDNRNNDECVRVGPVGFGGSAHTSEESSPGAGVGGSHPLDDTSSAPPDHVWCGCPVEMVETHPGVRRYMANLLMTYMQTRIWQSSQGLCDPQAQHALMRSLPASLARWCAATSERGATPPPCLPYGGEMNNSCLELDFATCLGSHELEMGSEPDVQMEVEMPMEIHAHRRAPASKSAALSLPPGLQDLGEEPVVCNMLMQMLDAAPIQQHDSTTMTQPAGNVGNASPMKCNGEAGGVYNEPVHDCGAVLLHQAQNVGFKEDESMLTTAQSSLSWLSNMVMAHGLWPAKPWGLQTSQEAQGQLGPSSLGGDFTPELAMSDLDGVVPSNHLNQNNTPSPPTESGVGRRRLRDEEETCCDISCDWRKCMAAECMQRQRMRVRIHNQPVPTHSAAPSTSAT